VLNVLFASAFDFVLLLELRLITFEFSWIMGVLSRDNEMVCPLKTESTSASEETRFKSSKEN